MLIRASFGNESKLIFVLFVFGAMHVLLILSFDLCLGRFCVGCCNDDMFKYNLY